MHVKFVLTNSNCPGKEEYNLILMIIDIFIKNLLKNIPDFLNISKKNNKEFHCRDGQLFWNSQDL